MVARTLLRSHAAPLLVAAARQRKVDVDAVLRALDLPLDIDRLTRAPMHLDTLRKLGDALASAAGDAFLGLKAGATLPPGTYGSLEYAIRSCASLREGASTLVAFGRAISDITTVSFEPTKRGSRLTERIVSEPLGSGRQVADFTLAVYVCRIRDLLDDRSWCPQTVLFPYPTPRERAPFATVFGRSRLVFGQRDLGIEISRADLDRPLVAADPRLRTILEDQLRAEHASAQPLRGARELLSRELREKLDHGQGAIELTEIAARMGTSARSLQRRLCAEGASYQAIVDEVRFDLAMAYMRERGLTLKEVAQRLGYSEPRAFARAFHRWTGLPPATWRRRNTSAPR